MIRDKTILPRRNVFCAAFIPTNSENPSIDPAGHRAWASRGEWPAIFPGSGASDTRESHRFFSDRPTDPRAAEPFLTPIRCKIENLDGGLFTAETPRSSREKNN
jgi:hypothetical protein